MEEPVEVRCPTCGAATMLFADPTGGTAQELIEDCQVCCNPIQFRIVWHDGRVQVTVETLDE